jgi:hypothetical protein
MTFLGALQGLKTKDCKTRHCRLKCNKTTKTLAISWMKVTTHSICNLMVLESMSIRSLILCLCVSYITAKRRRCVALLYLNKLFKLVPHCYLSMG